jgi:hypothetical protein
MGDGLLCRLASLPILPMVTPNKVVQPIHRDEVVEGILAAADSQTGGVLALAGPAPVAFGKVLQAFASAYYGHKLPILPVPLKLALLACDATAYIPLIPTVDRERVLGLSGTLPIESGADLDRLGVTVRPMSERLKFEPMGRRALIAEARALFGQVLGVSPGGALLRRYARGVTGSAIARPRLLPQWFEPLTGNSVLAERLRMASRLAEASAGGEGQLAKGSRFTRLLRLTGAMLRECLMLPTRWLGTLRAS